VIEPLDADAEFHAHLEALKPDALRTLRRILTASTEERNETLRALLSAPDSPARNPRGTGRALRSG
jgi:hypothetical protein